jgi:uncharacterized protein YdhG (YjbR/CyaY superfamily)
MPGKQGFTKEEKAAMRERSRELRSGEMVGEEAVRSKISEMSGTDRIIAERLHEIIRKHAPNLLPKLWYGMPAYANREGKIVCFFQNAGKFKSRYATLGFSDKAKLDQDSMWPTSFAITEITETEERKIVDLIRKATNSS